MRLVVYCLRSSFVLTRAFVAKLLWRGQRRAVSACFPTRKILSTWSAFSGQDVECSAVLIHRRGPFQFTHSHILESLILPFG
ncbi:hypothetical protein C8F04DRAFT_1064395 [Mycena alexandri]|uniref:Uncharacterized protein n=1 Tax=Mycena alexandri TaxID=1745969 RepID=A0AAD6TI04_9AGAR|nr:hypothetical protein C8F04DRAFT_1064395 [Mycena alexandri]